MWIQIILSLICHPPWIGFAPITIPLDEWVNRLVPGEVIMFSGCDMNLIFQLTNLYALKPSLLKLSSFPHLWISQFHHCKTIIHVMLMLQKKYYHISIQFLGTTCGCRDDRTPALCTKPIKIIRQLKCWITYLKCLNYSF